MKHKKALIIGIFGQDGYLMSKLLKKRNYKIIGIFRKFHRNKNKKHIDVLCKLDIKSYNKVKNIIKKYKPDEIYNFAGVSDLKTASTNFLENEKSINLFVLNILLILKDNRDIKFFNSLSSELFRNDRYSKKKIKTIKDFNPVNPYAISKLSAYYYSLYFRKEFNLKLYNGFLFNHESKYRSDKFIIPQIIKTFLSYKYNKKTKLLNLKNILSEKDFGSAQEYMYIIWKVLQQDKLYDFILGSEKKISLFKIIVFVAKYLNLNFKIIDKKKHIDFYCDKSLIISGNKIIENSPLIANNYLLRQKNLIKKKINFSNVLISMIEHYKKNLLKEKKIK
ncbi:GDP-mannose 4,6-dehydratase [Candidatus Pelagibacter sp.]|uniref:GDP-mannose 4,6-dehydratase n=1 Tax=Candidatus Pelagibacter sp. TaxID=2024849 RepID=UPI003F85A553